MPEPVSKHVDPWSMVVIILTLVLFIASLFIKGFTHELLLETGVFLVSVKLILLGHRNSLTSAAIEQKLERLNALLEKRIPDARLMADPGRS